MQQVRPNAYAETEKRGCNFGFVTTTEGVVMIDTPQLPRDAIAWRETVAAHGPVRYIINTEPHGDHVTGNFFFRGRRHRPGGHKTRPRGLLGQGA
jgi:cyclase